MKSFFDFSMIWVVQMVDISDNVIFVKNHGHMIPISISSEGIRKNLGLELMSLITLNQTQNTLTIHELTNTMVRKPCATNWKFLKSCFDFSMIGVVQIVEKVGNVISVKNRANRIYPIVFHRK